MGAQLTVQDLRSIIRRRKKAFFGLPIVIFLIAVAVALGLPDIYRSETTILIEGQEIPEDFIKSTITSYVEERLNLMTQRIMRYNKLAGLIQKFNPYPELLSEDEDATGIMVAELKKNIELENIIVSTGDGKNRVTTAFKLAYSGRDPQVVQNITQELASFYIEEDIRTKEKLASTTTEFLEAELENFRKQVAIHEARISDFKRAHVGELPEYERTTFQEIERAENTLTQIGIRHRELQKQKNFLLGQIATVEPLKPIETEDGKLMQNPDSRLKGLRLQLINLRSALSEKHPDVIKLKNMISELEAQVGESDSDIASIKQLQDRKAELATVRGKLGPKHPDVIALNKEVALLSEQVQSASKKRAIVQTSRQRPDNPTYINLMTQIENVNAELQGLNEQEMTTRMRQEEYKQKAARIPLVEKEYNELTLGYENAKKKYNDMLNKLNEANLSKQMEVTQRGERFTILEPAFLPQSPDQPNRLMIMMLGLVLGACLGIALTALQEGMDSSVKTAEDISQMAGVPVIANLSFIRTEEEVRRQRMKKAGWSLVFAVCIVFAIVVVDQFVMPIDMVWGKLQERLTTMKLPL
jgi:uncharacterized protein involved in exopolysaccharide biosynthesis